MTRLFAIASTFTPGKPQPPARDPEYRKWIRTLPSVVSGRYGCDPCHSGAHGISQKSSDYSCIPLTRAEHREFDEAPRLFAERHNLDIPALIEGLNSAYQQRMTRLPVRRDAASEGGQGTGQKRSVA